MTELYLNNSRVYPDSQLNIKLTRENPYFTDSDSYTLDVTLPMDILQNRLALGNLQRMDCSKQVRSMAARLVVDNKTVLNGSAIVTEVSERDVKVQLLQGYPSLKLLMKESDDFIDEIDMGTGIDPNVNRHVPRSASFKAQGVNGQHVYLPIYNETTDKIMNKYHYDIASGDAVYSNTVGQDLAAVQPNLLFVLRKVLQHYGFTLDAGVYDAEPWNSIYVASCKATRKLCKALPHWRSSDFFNEVANLFCARFVVSDAEKKVSLVTMKDYFSADAVVISPIDEYKADIEENAEKQDLLSSNIRYAVSDSIFHEWDIIPQEVVRACQPIAFDTYVEMAESDEASPHHNNIMVCPDGWFAYWERTNETTTPPCRRNKGFKREQINQFGALVRDESDDDSVELKICPSAMTDRQHLGDSIYPYYIYVHMPSKSEYAYVAESIEDMTAQERIENATEASNENEQSSADLMEVFFFDNTLTPTEYQNDSIPHDYEIVLPMAFTDAWMFMTGNGYHSYWSFALDRCNPTVMDFVGKLHKGTVTFNTKARHAFKFLSDQMPDPTRVYIIRGKRYGCEKIEANITADGLDRLMTGYFYEML